MNKIGLIAGNGKLPLLFARAAKDQKYTVVAAAYKGDASWLLRFCVDHVKWFGVGKLKSMLQYLQTHDIKKVIMAGQVAPEQLFDEAIEQDEEVKELFKAIKDRKTDTILGAVGDVLEKYGMTLMDSTLLFQKYLAPKGTLTKRAPTETELDDIDFGIDLAKQMGGLDIGQTVVVKEKAIVAIEAIEGTDRCILRGGQIARQGAVVVKQSKPEQDNRFDVPVIGPKTIQTMVKCKASCLAIEAGKTLIIDYDKVIKRANKDSICIVSA